MYFLFMTAKENKKINFAKSYAELEKVMAWFEKGDVNLEEGLKKFEEGSVLVKDLQQYLRTMENKITTLKKEIL